MTNKEFENLKEEIRKKTEELENLQKAYQKETGTYYKFFK